MANRSLRLYLQLARPEQYSKNAFVLAPLFFSGRITPAGLVMALGAMFVFCLMSSGIYAFNDWMDRDADRLHPTKQNRPLASGALSGVQGLQFAFGMWTLALVGAYLLLPGLAGVLLAYGGLQLLYSVWLKHVALIDVLCIAFGFVLRLVAGQTATHTHLSVWIVLETFLLALFLALAKRRTDFILMQQGHHTRRNIGQYRLWAIDVGLGLLAAAIVAAYLCYGLSADIQAHYHQAPVYWSTAAVAVGLGRYLYLAWARQLVHPPHWVLWHDRWVQTAVLLWIALLTYWMYV